MQQLSQKDVQDLMNEGYSMGEINDALREIEQEELTASYRQTQQTRDPRMYAQQSAFTTGFQDNLIKWQLELDNILERAEHILRGDVLVFDKGHVIWKPAKNDSRAILNDYGVQEIMKILSMYLNRNTILSDYSNEEIQEKILDFGRELNDLFFMKYEVFGLTDLEKRKNYPILIREIVDMVHSAYKRALFGGEKRSLREARQVTQTEPIMTGMGQSGLTINTGQQPRQRGIFNPMRYLVSKNK